MSFKGLISQSVSSSKNHGCGVSLFSVEPHYTQDSADDAARSFNSCSRSMIPLKQYPCKDSKSEATAEGQVVTAREATINLICGGLGTGMFSLPWSMAGASVVLGVLVIVLVVFVNAWTIMILVEAAEKYKCFDLGSLLRNLPGRIGIGMEVFTNIVLWVAMMLSLVSYLIAIHDSAIIFVKDSWLDLGRVPLVGFAALLVLPLCFLPQKYLSSTSLVATLANVNLFALLSTLFVRHGSEDTLPSESCILGLAKGSVTMVSAMMQCIIIQMCVLPMYQVLENRSPQNFRRVLSVAFTVLVGLFSGFSVLAYLIFGPTVESNVLLNLPRDMWSDVSQASVVFVVLAVYPLMLLPMLAPIRSLDITWFLSRKENAEKLTSDDERLLNVAIIRRRRAVNFVTVAVVAISCVGACYTDSLGFINVVDGSLCVGVFTSLVPGLVGLFLLERHSKVWKTSMVALMCIGIVASIVGLAFTDNFQHALDLNCIWHMQSL